MTTTRKAPAASATPTPETNPLTALLETATFETKKTDSSRARDRVAATVPDEYVTFVKNAFEANRRVVLPATDKDKFDEMANLFRAAGDKAELSVTVKARYDGEGEDAKLTHLTFTVGARRGAKGKKGDGNAPVAESK
jgi:hypothetical protein